MIGFYNYTVWLTYLGFSSSVVGIILALTGHPYLATICLMFSGLCDMFDGKVARTKKNRTSDEKQFGIQLDSLSDLVCFGVLPSIIGYEIGIQEHWMMLLLIFYPLAALIRLAYFNVLEINRNNSNVPVENYKGLPVTSSALIFPFLFIFKKLVGKYFALVYAITMLIVGFLFIANIKIKKPKMKIMLLFILFGVIEIALTLLLK